MYPNSSTTPLYVALDIGKNVHTYAAYSGSELAVVCPPQEVRSDRGGYEHLLTFLRHMLGRGQYAPVIVGLEPTGIYHEAWAAALQRDLGDRIQLRLLNPLQTKQKRVQLQGGRRRKTDARDDRAIAHCLRDGLGHPWWERPQSQVRWELWASDYRHLQHDLQQLQEQLTTQLDRLWPGAWVDVAAFHKAHPHLPLPQPLVLSRPLERHLVRVLLVQTPNPYDWLDCSPTDIQTRLRAQGLACGRKTALKLYTLVQQAVLPPQAVAERLATHLQTEFARYCQGEARLEQLRQQAEEWVPDSPAAVLTSVPGIGAYLAAQYLTYVGDPQRFQSADQIWALAGLDVEQNDSGDRRRTGKISKQGPAGMRRMLYQLGLTTSRSCAAIAQAKQRAQARGKGSVGAVLHAAHKANRLCFHLLITQDRYDPHQAH